MSEAPIAGAKPPMVGGRTRWYLEFIAAVVLYFLARTIARHGAEGLANEAWNPLVEQAMLLFLLVLGFGSLGFIFDRQKKPVSEQGLPLRKGWAGEAGVGVAVGWGAAVACVLPLALIGGIAIVLSTDRAAWGWLAADTAFFAVAAMVEEVTFRGYAFQRFVGVLGPVGASLAFAAFYGVFTALQPGSSRLSTLVSVLLCLLLSMSYLRTRALWVSWGLNFGWKASRALIFGLTVSGVSSHSSIVEGDPMGPFWMTGGGYGLDGSWLALVALAVAFPVVYRLTRELDFRYNVPVFVPGGIPVDLDAAARKQHEAAMGTQEPPAPSLVQILPVTQPPTARAPENVPASEPEGRPE
ncbi:MAG: lysostaphin resistance A-like protein [Terracidiphilus sp.]